MRQTKQETYFNICKDWAKRSSCTRRQCGAILVKNDTVFSQGYNGSVRGSLNCGEETPCLKDLHNEEPLKSYVHCPAVHAETNCIMNAARNGLSTLGATLYLYSSTTFDTGQPCMGCRRFLIQAGIRDCYYMNGKGEIKHDYVEEWIDLENVWMTEEQKINC